MNLTILSGNLGADPELRRTQSGTAVLSLRLATTERVKKGETWEDWTEWHTVVLFGRRAESLSGMLRKGSKVLVRGVLRTSSWEKDGVKRYKTEINADDVELMDSRERSGAPAADRAPQRPAPASDFDGGDGGADDIPF